MKLLLGPGDIIGNRYLDRGVSRETHNWIVAYEQCDLLIIDNEYMNVSILS